MEENTASQLLKEEKQYSWLKPYQWKKGQSGNPLGKRPRKKMRTWLAEYFESLDDAGKMEFLRYIPAELAIRLAEGNPKQENENSGEVTLKTIIINRPNGNSNNKPSS